MFLRHYSTDSLQHLDIPEVRHFLYRSRKSLSVTCPELPSIYSEEEDRLRYGATTDYNCTTNY